MSRKQFDPRREDDFHKMTIGKEFQVRRWGLEDQAASNLSVRRAESESAFYRIPQAGHIVQVNGMRHRPHLNGAHAEVTSNGVDEQGYLTVRVLEDTIAENGGEVSDGGSPGRKRSNKMKVHASRIISNRTLNQPEWRNYQTPDFKPPLTPVLPTIRLSHRISDGKSACSLSSSVGSLASYAGRRSSGTSRASRRLADSTCGSVLSSATGPALSAVGSTLSAANRGL